MGLIASSKGGDFPIAPAGTHPARCYLVVDLGTQPETYQGKPKPTHKVRIGFELPNEKHVFFEEKGEEPFTLSKEYTVSLSDRANLRKDLEAWRGKAFTEEELKGFDISKLLGAQCLVNVVHKLGTQTKRTYATIQGIMPVPKGMSVPPAVNKPIIFALEDGVKSPKFAALPEWIQNEIRASLELNGQPTTQSADATEQDSDSMPF